MIFRHAKPIEIVEQLKKKYSNVREASLGNNDKQIS